ncbi:hypothetical protein RJ640_007566 [Escallonia rubra]|uniref:Cyclin-D1-binding protein 1 n=1 Tax=Escallonia rubra TaxID=112253 RepID=A0AA88S3F7_9ASTE|nr:hypothetical protein RJ640_007566 [Escallonia rubra]
MGKGARERLSRLLNEHLNTVHETFQLWDQTPASSLDKVSWNDVIKLGEQVSKQATMVGMLWTGEAPETKVLEENMASYFNLLQGFLLHSHASTVGAGPTLSSCIYASVKQVVDCSFMLLKESVSSYESHSKDQKLSIPQLVGAVWDACSALKKTPTTNVTAIGRAMTQVAVSMKDVLREMKELKPASERADEASDEASIQAESQADDGDDSSEGDLGNDLSPEEMKIAKLAIGVMSEALVVMKELIRSITGLLKHESLDNSVNFLNSLERLLKLCQGIGVQMDELGACLYPPQELPTIKAASEKICSNLDEMKVELDNLDGSSEAFVQACSVLRKSMRQLESQLGYSDATDLVPALENLTVGNQ